MKLSLDTANLDEIRQALDWGVLRGVTTNPSHIAKADTDFLPLVKEICSLVDGDVSIETTGDDGEVLVRQGREIAQIAENAVVKVPMLPSCLGAVAQLSSEGIKVNVTLVFTPTQAILAAEAGAYIVSPFLGRLDDIATDSLRLLADVCEIYAVQGYDTQVLAASLRHPLHVVEAARMGADIATMPFKVFQSLIKHPLSDAGFKRFTNDWEEAKPRLGELLPSMQEA